MNLPEETQKKILLAPKKQMSQAGNCIRILEETIRAWKQGIPADKFLSGFFRENHQYGSRDRHVISETVFAFFRWYGWILQSDKKNEKTLEWKVLLALAAEQETMQGLYVYWCRKAGFDEQKFADIAAMNGEPQQRVSAFTAEFPDAEKGFVPENWIPEWALQEIAPEHRNGFLNCLQSRPPLWLRIQKGNPSDVLKRLQKTVEQKIRIDKHPQHPESLKIRGGNLNLSGLSLWRNGNLEVQDFSSQCIGFAANPEEGGKWWDVCAGSGGKSLQLSAGMKGKGSILAGDIRSSILQELQKRAERGGTKLISVEKYPAALPPLRHKVFDGVLVDAPCSSSGRWRRNPEARFAMTPADLERIVDLQKKILDCSAEAVRFGGVLIYGTCSVFARENLGVVRDFLSRHPDFSLEKFPDPHTGNETPGFLQTLPSDADCDGSFVARFRRKKETD